MIFFFNSIVNIFLSELFFFVNFKIERVKEIVPKKVNCLAKLNVLVKLMR